MFSRVKGIVREHKKIEAGERKIHITLLTYCPM